MEIWSYSKKTLERNGNFFCILKILMKLKLFLKNKDRKHSIVIWLRKLS
jgi:hypothetical protein